VVVWLEERRCTVHPAVWEGEEAMRTRFGWMIGVVVVGIVLAASTLVHAQAKPIKIGQIIPITGEAAESGKYHK
jgi:hypothetical protein